ncbi:13614_t:CDS:1 [Cetraspora pellucida]|uniref:13614_t:CDS:1 n=1 Tax=Cetraspora pellucida TaxID=1433469 RepID=A0A9N9NPZ7_9GLOM|nr:13614_t:CDS:1 [Cetraspora pellucida]
MNKRVFIWALCVLLFVIAVTASYSEESSETDVSNEKSYDSSSEEESYDSSSEKSYDSSSEADFYDSSSEDDSYEDSHDSSSETSYNSSNEESSEYHSSYKDSDKHDSPNYECSKYGDSNNGNSSQCPCSSAEATFSGRISGVMLFIQKPCGGTVITGAFRDGFVDPGKNCYTFKIQSANGELRDITNDLHVKFVNDGTEPFKVRIPNLTLNCDKNGILGGNDPRKRDYLWKRSQNATQNATMCIFENGKTCGQAPINLL